MVGDIATICGHTGLSAPGVAARFTLYALQLAAGDANTDNTRMQAVAHPALPPRRRAPGPRGRAAAPERAAL